MILPVVIITFLVMGISLLVDELAKGLFLISSIGAMTAFYYGIDSFSVRHGYEGAILAIGGLASFIFISVKVAQFSPKALVPKQADAKPIDTAP